MTKEARMKVVYFRGKPTCVCMRQWLPVFEAELQRRGLLKGQLLIFQLQGGAAASAGTHGKGDAADLQRLTGKQRMVARQMGAASWGRGPANGMINHEHLVLIGAPHNGPARYQVVAYKAGFSGLGLAGRGSRDPFRRPKKIRTWKQGLKWALKKQGKTAGGSKEDIMKLARKKQTWKKKQKIPNGKYGMLRIGTTKKGNRALSITGPSHHQSSWVDLCAEFTIRGLPEGERVAIQFYRKHTKTGKVLGYKSLTIDGTEYVSGTNRSIRKQVRLYRKPGKNYRTRVRAQATTSGVTIESLTAFGVL